MLSTSRDNTLRVWSKDAEELASMPHNNNTGRWISPFRGGCINQRPLATNCPTNGMLDSSPHTCAVVPGIFQSCLCSKIRSAYDVKCPVLEGSGAPCCVPTPHESWTFNQGGGRPHSTALPTHPTDMLPLDRQT